MLGNVFTKSLHQIADTRLSQDQSLLAEMWELQIRLNSGHFDDAWVDALMQPYNRPYGVHDAFGFAILWSALLRGDIYHAVCDIGEHCGADRLVERNNRAVSGLTQLAAGDGTFVRCNGVFHGGLSDSDGRFAWLDSMAFSRHACDRCSTNISCSNTIVEIVIPFRYCLRSGRLKSARPVATSSLKEGWLGGQTLLQNYIFSTILIQAVTSHPDRRNSRRTETTPRSRPLAPPKTERDPPSPASRPAARELGRTRHGV